MTELPFPEADLREHAPRSPRVELAGLVLMARTVDKARAKLQGTLGEYKIGPGLSAYLLDMLGIGEDDFLAAVRELREDEPIAVWIRAHSDPSAYAEINQRFETRRIRDAEHRAQFSPRYPFLDEKPEMWNWFEILEYDDRESFTPTPR
ncbi:MAG: DUF5069 domain-containing protein [Candidatus Eremiobacteraeota bacterium]|nr:DUF5069 domain-containing protein [Candidatus Eremiobacteraeota bacterium]